MTGHPDSKNSRAGIVVRSDPYATRGGRERLDIALVCASLDCPLTVFFIGDGLLHLAQGQKPETLSANRYTRGWLALADLADEIDWWVESGHSLSLDNQLPLMTAEPDRLRAEMGKCRVLFHV